MSEFHWFALDVKAYIADTLRLDAHGHGVYFMLLLDYYQHGQGCRADDTVIRTIGRCTDPKVWARIKPEIMELFEVRDGRLWHARCEEEIAKAREIASKNNAGREQRSEAGKASAAKRWGKQPSERSSETEGNEIGNDRGNDRHDDRDANNNNNSKKERTPYGSPKKEIPPDGGTPPRIPDPPRILDHPIPSDFALAPEDLIRCQSDGADPPWVWNVFGNWKTQMLETGALQPDWKAAWWRRWEKSKPKPDPDRGKPRLVLNGSGDPKGRGIEPPAKRKTPLPKDWMPNASNAAVCAEEGRDLDRMVALFRDGCEGSGYRYIDHHKAFNNWVRNQKNFERGNAHGKAAARGSIVAAADRALANIDRRIAEIRAAEGGDTGGEDAVPKLPED